MGGNCPEDPRWNARWLDIGFWSTLKLISRKVRDTMMSDHSKYRQMSCFPAVFVSASMLDPGNWRRKRGPLRRAAMPEQDEDCFYHLGEPSEYFSFHFSSFCSHRCPLRATFQATRQPSGLGGNEVKCRLTCVCSVVVMRLSDPNHVS